MAEFLSDSARAVLDSLPDCLQLLHGGLIVIVRGFSLSKNIKRHCPLLLG